MRLLLVFVILIVACSWSRRDTRMELAYAATALITACDVGGTVAATDFGRYDRGLQEVNPLMQAMPGFGARPSVTAMVMMPAAATAASYAFVRSDAPAWTRWAWLGLVTVVEGYAVVSNSRWVGACGVVGANYRVNTEEKR